MLLFLELQAILLLFYVWLFYTPLIPTVSAVPTAYTCEEHIASLKVPSTGLFAGLFSIALVLIWRFVPHF